MFLTFLSRYTFIYRYFSCFCMIVFKVVCYRFAVCGIGLILFVIEKKREKKLAISETIFFLHLQEYLDLEPFETALMSSTDSQYSSMSHSTADSGSDISSTIV